MKFRIVKIVAFTLSFCIVGLSRADDAVKSDDPFLPTWKLLNQEQKVQFVAGYLYGWTDARRVIDVALDYVRQNPKDAVSGLEKIRALYDMGGLKADTVAREIDSFYSDSQTKEASLSQAITAVRSRFGR